MIIKKVFKSLRNQFTTLPENRDNIMIIKKVFKSLRNQFTTLPENCNHKMFEEIYSKNESDHFFHHLSSKKVNGMMDDYYHVYSINGKYYVTCDDLVSYVKFCSKATILNIHHLSVNTECGEKTISLYQVDPVNDKCHSGYKKVEMGLTPLFNQ